MAYIHCVTGGSGGGIPPQLQSDMDSVLNKKLGTSTSYPSTSWAKEVNLMGLLPEKTVSGAVASFPDGADDVPIKTATFDIDPTLDGVSEVNVTRTGKNLFDPSTVFTATGSYMYAKSIFPKNTNLICKFVDKDPTVDISGISFGFLDDTYVSGGAQSGHYRWLINSGTVQSNLTNSPSGGGSVLCDGLFAFPKNQTTIDTLLARFDIQVEVGTVSTDYIAYSATTRTISLGQTVYGGSVTVDEDGECELEETFSLKIDLGSLSWSKNANNRFYSWDIRDLVVKPSNNNEVSTMLCDDDFTVDTYNNVYTNGTTDKGISISKDGAIGVNCTDYASYTATQFKNAVSGVYISYPLATPTTSTLTPITPINTLEGVNNIWCDTGDVETLTYRQSSALPTEQVLTDGQVSTLSDYATANYTKSVDGFGMITIRLKDTVNGVYYEDIQTFKVSSIGSGISVNFALHTTVTVSVTKTSISGYSYGGDWQNIYADVVAFSDSIFDN